MARSTAPIADKVIDDTGKMRPSWVEYFSSSERGDIGTTWNPVITNLASTGTPTITGVYYQNQGFTDFAIKIVPGTNTSSTAGTTTVALPFSVTSDTVANTVTGTTAALGVVNASGKTIFLPTWSAITTPITISGRVKN